MNSMPKGTVNVAFGLVENRQLLRRLYSTYSAAPKAGGGASFAIAVAVLYRACFGRDFTTSPKPHHSVYSFQIAPTKSSRVAEPTAIYSVSIFHFVPNLWTLQNDRQFPHYPYVLCMEKSTIQNDMLNKLCNIFRNKGGDRPILIAQLKMMRKIGGRGDMILYFRLFGA